MERRIQGLACVRRSHVTRLDANYLADYTFCMLNYIPGVNDSSRWQNYQRNPSHGVESRG